MSSVKIDAEEFLDAKTVCIMNVLVTGGDAAVAVLTATASNNLLKAAYTIGFTGHRRGLPVVGTLVLLSGAAVLFGFLLTRH